MYEYEIFAVFVKFVSFNFSVTKVQHAEFIDSEYSVEQTASVGPQHESSDDERVSKRCVLIEIPHELQVCITTVSPVPPIRTDITRREDTILPMILLLFTIHKYIYTICLLL